MPGCTALNCTNSSQKGYKLYHFPSDPERCALWVRYCDREEGWQPTKHMCLCETHFEESQFESHRADGLKKLKPFAVPTKFNKPNPICTIVRGNVNEDPGKTALKHEREKKISISKINLLNEDNTNLQNPSERTKSLLENSESLKKRKETVRRKRKICLSMESYEESSLKGRQDFKKLKELSYVKNNVSINENSVCASSCSLNESKLPCGSKDIKLQTNCSELQGKCDESEEKTRKNYDFISRSKDSLMSVLRQSPMTNVEKTLTSCKKNVCFICDQNIKKCVALSSCTDTSKMQFDQKLLQLVVQEFDMLVESSDVLCEFCAQTLNCIDYVESVFHTLSKGILNHVKKKFGMGPTEEIDLLHYIKFLKNLNDFYKCKEFSNTHLSVKKHSNESSLNLHVKDSHMFESIEKCQRNNNIELVSANNNFECQICSFETSYKAVMVFHLRQHFQHSYSCDFCNTPVVLDTSFSFNTSCKGSKYLKSKHSVSCKEIKINEADLK